MSALLDSLTAAAEVDASRHGALAAIRGTGLPGARSEAWKYTPLRALERRVFASPGAVPLDVDAAIVADIPAPRLVFVNGRPSPALSDLAGLPDGVSFAAVAIDGSRDGSGRPDDVFARLGAVLARDGAGLRVTAGLQVEPVLHLVLVGAPAPVDQAWHLRHRVEVGAGASVRLLEHQLGAAPHAHLDNSVVQVDVGAGATLAHVRVQHGASGATTLLRTDASLSEGAEYRRVDLELGAGLSRHELNVRLAGTGARLIANGVLPANGRRHLDTRLGIEHLAPDTACDLLWRGVADGRARAVFHGGITIHAGADGSNANLSNKNLLLSDAAEIDTQPVLVIHADEVKAAHGATVGQLDATALFYLRSRGLPEAEARRLLTAAFVREPLAVIRSPVLRALLEGHLHDVFGALQER